MTPPADTALFWYRAYPIRVIDGDTIVVQIDLGLRVNTDVSLRVAGINTPEITGPERSRGMAARDVTVGWIDRATADGDTWPLIIHTHRDGQTFNRYIADVYDATTGGSLADTLRQAGYT